MSENFGDSSLAERFGVTRYPAVFVDDVLVARPRDFGFFGKEEEKSGRYTPWRRAASQAKFQKDLARMIDLVLAGGRETLRAERAEPEEAGGAPARLPSFALTDLSGRRLASADLAGRPVLVEFWATWCPPCRSTLSWLARAQERRTDALEVVAFGVESPEGEVRNFASSVGGGVRWAIADPETARAFGDVASVPMLFLFDRDGRAAAAFYGAPPDLHERIEKALAALPR